MKNPLANISFTLFKKFNSEPKQKQQTMNFEKISALVGREITAENFSSLTAAEFAKVEGAVASVPAATNPTATPAATNEPAAAVATAAPVATPAATAEETPMNAASIAEIVAQTMATSLAPIVQRLETLEGAPGATATEKPRAEEKEVDANGVPLWQSTEAESQKKVRQFLGQ